MKTTLWSTCACKTRSAFCILIFVAISCAVADAQVSCPPGASATGGVITCANPCISLAGATVSGDAFSWSGPGIVSGASTANPTVCVPGVYTLVVTNTGGGCTSTATATVVQNTSPPGAFVTGGVISCSDPSTTIFGGTTSGTGFQWAGPGGFSSTLQNPTVGVGGIYTLTVTNSLNGCTSTAVAVVVQNAQPPGATAAGGIITCSNPRVTLSGGTISGTNFLWNGPNGFSSTLQNPVVGVRGTYTLSVTNTLNGCISTAQAVVIDLCRLGLGEWKNASILPVAEMFLGTVRYDSTQLKALLRTPVGIGSGADASLILVHQLIAANLNIANGANYPVSINDVISSANQGIGNRTIPMQVRPNTTQGQLFVTSASLLESYYDVPLEPPPIFLKGVAREGVIPSQFALEQNYPNPFNPTTTIRYDLPQYARVTLDVYDVLGRRVAELVTGEIAAGTHEAEFNASSLASGIYFYRMTADGVDGLRFIQMRKLMLLK